MAISSIKCIFVFDKPEILQLMKNRFLIIIILLFTGLTASAQSSYKGFVEGGYGFLSGDKNGSVYQFSTAHGLLFRNCFIGAGLGLDYYSVYNPGYDPDYVIPTGDDGFGHFEHVRRFTGFAVPVFINIKALWDGKKISPDFDIKTGLTAGFALGLFGEVGTGCRIKLNEKSSVCVNAFYKLAHEPNNIVTDDSAYMEGTFSIIGLKVLFGF